MVVVSTGKLFMKIRQGHVSNSSSSSFIVVIKDDEELDKLETLWDLVGESDLDVLKTKEELQDHLLDSWGGRGDTFESMMSDCWGDKTPSWLSRAYQALSTGCYIADMDVDYNDEVGYATVRQFEIILSE